MTRREPVQEFFSIGDVCELTDLKPHVLRYWESQFRFLNPGEEPLRQSRLSAARDRADHAREAPAVHREVHDRRRAAEDRRAPEGRRAARRSARAALERCRRSPIARATSSRSCVAVLDAREAAFADSARRLPRKHVSARSSCTNDDGILAHGLECLVRAARAARRRARRRARPRAERDESFAHAAPSAAAGAARRAAMAGGRHADRLRHARRGGAACRERPDFVLSGINHGQNMGEDVLYSGTVAAAMEGLALGIPSIAFSFAGGDLRADLSQLDEQVERAHAAAAAPHRRCRRSRPTRCSTSTCRPCRAEQVRGVRLTRLGRPRLLELPQADEGSVGSRHLLDRRRRDLLVGRADDSDFRAIQEGYISVTPLHLDLTHFGTCWIRGERWWRDP